MRQEEITRFTDVGLAKLPAPAKGNKVYYDGADKPVPGFGVRVTAAGHRSFVLTYRTKGGRERRYTIGDAGGAGGWTIGEARIEARRLRKLIDEGGDPLGDIEAARQAENVRELCDRFESEHLRPRTRASTVLDYQSMIALHIKPALGRLKVAEVTFTDIDRLHRKLTAAGYPYRANRVVAVLSKMFSLAVKWKMRDDNPVKGVERNKEFNRRRYLDGDELVRLTKALAKYPNQQTANIFRLALLTGARRGEVLSMRWADIDLTAGKWSKPPSSTKQKEHHQVPLSAPARQLLSNISDQQSGKHPKKSLGEFVFPGAGKTGHVAEVKRAWRWLCKSANIANLRIHDLRHSYASQLASGGASLPLIGALLGHSNPATTARYAHLFQDPQRAATEQVGAIIANAGKPPAEVVTLPKRRGR